MQYKDFDILYLPEIVYTYLDLELTLLKYSVLAEPPGINASGV